MKREAERQITQDDPDDEIEEIPSPGTGFKKADDAVLATRQIRGLPRRSLATTPTVDAPTNTTVNGTSALDTLSTPPFGGFAGFGSPSNTNAFTFTPPPASPSTPGSSTSSPAPKLLFEPDSASQPPKPNPPLVSATASSATKAFASFLSPPSSRPADLTSQNNPHFASNIGTQDPADEADAADAAAVEYYSALRGLNVAFLAALSQALEDDPFIDAAEVLEKYKTLRLNIQKDYDSKQKPSKTEAPKAAPTLPVPPISFTGFGAQKVSSSTSSTVSLGGGFTPKVDSSKPSTSAFSLFTPPASGPPNAAASSAFGNPFLSATSTSKDGQLASNGTASASGAPAPSLFGSSVLSSSAFPLFGTSPTKSGATSTTTNLFGSSATASSSDSPPGRFKGFGGFGKPSGTGSIGNPVGFSFGSPPKTSDNTASLVFGDTGQQPEDKQQKDDPGEGSGEATAEANADPYAILGKNPHDEEGEGEENEETIHAIKLRAYRLTKGASSWSELGYGVLRVKKHKETGARRLLLRNSSTGKININFHIYAGLKPALAKRTVTFVGHDNGVSQPYTVRLQTEDQARELENILEREIALVKAKAET